MDGLSRHTMGWAKLGWFRRGGSVSANPVDNSSPSRLLYQGSRFVATGAANSILTFALYQTLASWLPYAAAYALCFAAGIAFSAVVNSRLVFSSRLTWLTALRFALTYCALCAAGLGVTITLVEWLNIPSRIAPIGTAVLLLPVGFFASRFALTSSPVEHMLPMRGARDLNLRQLEDKNHAH